MEQQIRFCTTSDGVRIAYATVGKGPPLVRVLGWFTHLELDWETPWIKAAVEAMARKCTYIRYDGRGMGLSDRDITDFSVESQVRDLEAVIDAVGLAKVALYALSQGGPVAITYATRHPERVSRLVLYGAFARIPPPRDERQAQLRQAMLTMVREGWGSDNPAFRQTWTAMFMPDADAERIRWFNDIQRAATSADNAAAFLSQAGDYDVRDLLPAVNTPTLIAHCRGDKLVRFELGRELAAAIPNARFLPLESDNHALGVDEPAWQVFRQNMDKFLAEERKPAKRKSPETAAARAGLVTIMFTDMEGSTTLTQRLGDARAQDVLRTHNTIVRDALKAHSGSETKHTGDGIMASFASASKALEAAVAIQRTFTDHNESAETPIRVRIGLNAGEPVAEDEDLFGTAVQLAARICAHAEPGQILASNVVRELSAGKGIMFSDRGEVTLRGFEEPVRLYEVRWG
jgi:class 3 adenylate cyclase/pimeloyl-ACP methyl ester carboxylesterase